jgi:hypothetical protein
MALAGARGDESIARFSRPRQRASDLGPGPLATVRATVGLQEADGLTKAVSVRRVNVVGEDSVHYQENKGIGWITLNRPAALNALNKDVLRRLTSVLDQAGTEDAIKAVIITGQAKRLSLPAPN